VVSLNLAHPVQPKVSVWADNSETLGCDQCWNWWHYLHMLKLGGHITISDVLLQRSEDMITMLYKMAVNMWKFER